MALTGRAHINPEDLRDGNGTLRRALELWICRHGPIQYNQWQSLYFSLIREHNYKDEDAFPLESASARQQRIRAMFSEIQEAIHGPDHLAAALIAVKRGTQAGLIEVPAGDDTGSSCRAR